MQFSARFYIKVSFYRERLVLISLLSLTYRDIGEPCHSAEVSFYREVSAHNLTVGRVDRYAAGLSQIYDRPSA